jgi:tetratricopeptide (TPR) repeat protein
MGFCSFCGRFVKFRSWSGMKFFHLYFIPLIPLGGRMRNHKMCTKCSMLREISVEEFEATIERLKEFSAHAILSLHNGDTTFSMDQAPSEPINSLEFLIGAVDWFQSINETEFNQGIAEQLNRPTLGFANAMLNAQLETMAGRLDQAIQRYLEASSQSSVADPHLMRAQLQIEKRRIAEAIESLKAALKLVENTPQELGVRLQLAAQHMTVKDYAEASQHYDKVLQLQPAYLNDKAFMKEVNKAKKKSNV